MNYYIVTKNSTVTFKWDGWEFDPIGEALQQASKLIEKQLNKGDILYIAEGVFAVNKGENLLSEEEDSHIKINFFDESCCKSLSRKEYFSVASILKEIKMLQALSLFTDNKISLRKELLSLEGPNEDVSREIKSLCEEISIIASVLDDNEKYLEAVRETLINGISLSELSERNSETITFIKKCWEKLEEDDGFFEMYQYLIKAQN